MKTLYIHIPFCYRKCFYCSFVVSVGQTKRIDEYLDGIELEAKRYRDEEIISVYVGGGTPTYMNEQQIERLQGIIHDNFKCAGNPEWTIEANPEGINDNKLNVIKNLGFNRISLGVQSFNDRYLKYLGRNHDADTAIKAYARIREKGFDNINVDMMFAFPGQEINDLKTDINTFKKMESNHISLYMLTVEKNSRFYTRNVKLQEDHVQAEKYALICDELKRTGYEQYEISNFAHPSKMSRHNTHYWEGGEYIGLGIGAHSYINGRRFWNTRKLIDYIQKMRKGISPEEGFEVLSIFDQMKDVILFGLRMNKGVDIKLVEKKFGCSLDSQRKERIDYFIQNGFLAMEEDHLKASEKGRMVLDELCAQLV